MAVTSKLPCRLQVLTSQAVCERVQAIADHEGISVGQVCREIIEHGLPWRETRDTPDQDQLRKPRECPICMHEAHLPGKCRNNEDPDVHLGRCGCTGS